MCFANRGSPTLCLRRERLMSTAKEFTLEMAPASEASASSLSRQSKMSTLSWSMFVRTQTAARIFVRGENHVESSSALLFVMRSYRSDGGGRRRGGPGSWCKGRHQTCSRTRIRQGPARLALQDRSGRAGCEDRRPCRLRRHYHRRRHAVRTTVVANGQFPGPGRWPMDARSVARKGRRGIHLKRHATWWAGDDAVLDHHQSLALRHGDRRPRLRPCGPDDP